MPRDKKVAKKKLTLKQAKFTKEYLKSGNGTKAAIKAGYSKKSAHDIASENLRKPEIKAKIQDAAEKLGINPEYVLGNLKEIADFNKKTFTRKITKVVGEGSNTKVEEIEEIKMIDPQASIRSTELLGKHLKLFVDKVELDAQIENTNSEDQQINDAARAIAFLLAKSQSK